MISGACLGAGVTTATAYLTEIAPEDVRGAVVEACELMLCLGCLVAYITAAGVGDEHWMVTILVAVLPVVVQATAMVVLLHESPRWLMAHGREKQALEVRVALGLAPDSQHKEQELAVDAHQGAVSKPKAGWQKLWMHKRYILLALGIALAHSVTAANTILYYSRNVLVRAGVHQPLLANILVGLVKLSGAALAMVLVDRCGRRKMLLRCNAGIVASQFCLVAAFGLNPEEPQSELALGGMLCFILFWNLSWSGLMMMVASEVLPQSVRSEGLGMVYFLYQLGAFVQEQTLETLFDGLGVAETFAIYGTLTAFGQLFVWRCIPETGGRSLEVTKSDSDSEGSANVSRSIDSSTDPSAESAP